MPRWLSQNLISNLDHYLSAKLNLVEWDAGDSAIGPDTSPVEQQAIGMSSGYAVLHATSLSFSFVKNKTTAENFEQLLKFHGLEASITAKSNLLVIRLSPKK